MRKHPLEITWLPASMQKSKIFHYNVDNIADASMYRIVYASMWMIFLCFTLLASGATTWTMGMHPSVK